MSKSHLVIDFPTKTPAAAKSLADDLPPLMPEFAKVQDGIGTVHFSRFMVEGGEKLLFLSDIDGEGDTHIERLVERAAPVFDAIFTHVDDPPATPVASNPQKVIKWLKRHVREPIDTYFANDASVQDIREYAREAGFRGNTTQNALLTYWQFKSRLQAFAMKMVAGAVVGEKGIRGRMQSARCMSPISCPLRRTTWASSPSSTGISRGTSRTSPRTRSSSTRSFHMSLARRQPQSARTPRRSINGRWPTTSPPSGSTAAIQVSRCSTFEPCSPITSHSRPPPDSRGSHVMTNRHEHDNCVVHGRTTSADGG